MKIARETLDERLRILISRLEKNQPLYDELEAKHKIPVSVTSDVCANRKDISEVNNFIAFAMLSALKPGEVPKYFTEEEIKFYSVEQYETNKVEFPFVFKNMVQVCPDQWIGTISCQTLMSLKDSQLIRYNENTQRTLKRISRGDDEYFKIFLNNKSVEEIKRSFEEGFYIPDDITLNIPMDYSRFIPNRNGENVGDYIVEEPGMMDILDGYHRYIALSRITREYPDFDYQMEIRLVNFTEEKAKQFIFQKDQKTRMRRVYSNSMNQYSVANQVVDYLNTSPKSNIQGEINRNKGNIDYSFLSALIAYYYFSKQKKYTRKDAIMTQAELEREFNLLTTQNTDWLEHRFTERELQIIMFCFANDITDSAVIQKLITASESMDKTYFQLNQNGGVRKKTVNELKKLLKGVRDV